MKIPIYQKHTLMKQSISKSTRSTYAMRHLANPSAQAYKLMLTSLGSILSPVIRSQIVMVSSHNLLTRTFTFMMKTVYPFNYLTMGRATLPHRSSPLGVDDDWLWSCFPAASASCWGGMKCHCGFRVSHLLPRFVVGRWGADTCE